ncbi:hypothetical protein F5Y12DRAFT_774376 [Xylaria sp. FL1777]|nr:hypothetical protein F5Y12DRAFT_774376 [Xylaria sp. FL1777]
MPKRQRTPEEVEIEIHPSPAEALFPALSIEEELGLLRCPDPIGPRILVAAMVGGDNSFIPEGMRKSTEINFLVGKRLVSPGFGTWSYPCGLLERGERIMTCAFRVVFKQTRLQVEPELILRTTENVTEGEHYITIFVFCGLPADDKKRVEKFDRESTGWHWSTLTKEDAEKMRRGEEPGKPVFAPLVTLYDEEETRSIDWETEPGIPDWRYRTGLRTYYIEERQ